MSSASKLSPMPPSPEVRHLLDGRGSEGALWLALEAARLPGFTHRLCIPNAGPIADLARAIAVPFDRGHSPLPNDAVTIAWGRTALDHLGRPQPGIPLIAIDLDRPAPITRLGLRRLLAPTTPSPAVRLSIHWSLAQRRAPSALTVQPGPLDLPDLTPTLPPSGTLRAQLGLRAGESALALLADPLAAGDARDFVHVLGVLALAGLNVVGLIHSGTPGLDRAARFTGLVGERWRIVVYNGSQLHAAAASQAVLWHQGRAIQQGRPLHPHVQDAGLVLASMVLAAGTPVVTDDTPLATPLALRARGRLAVTTNPEPRHIAGALWRVLQPTHAEAANASPSGESRFTQQLAAAIDSARSPLVPA
jgi:hypothetical protein